MVCGDIYIAMNMVKKIFFCCIEDDSMDFELKLNFMKL